MLLVFIFVVGGVVGYEVRGAPAAPMAGVSPMEPHTFVARLSRDLVLDSSQSAAILSMMLRRQATIDSAWRALRPSVRATIDSAQADITKILRPDQRTKYLELMRGAHPTM